MSRLDGLIRELCPDGVERKALGEITTSINIGINPRKFFALNPPDATGFYVTVRELNGLQGVKQYEKTDTISAKAVEIIQGRANIAKGDILFSNTGTVGKMALVLEDPTNWGVNEGIYIIKPRHDVVLSKFLYYFLSGTEAYQDYSKKFTGSTLKHVTQKALAEISIPVPPLEVQQEIVRILDTFANLTAELQAELQARKQQYAYNRDKLLTECESAKWVTLGDLGRVSMCKRILKSETATEGDVPFFKIGTFGKTADAFISQETFEKYKSMYSYPKKGDILISAAGTIGRTVVFDGKPAYFQDSNIVWIANDESLVLNKFLYYYYQIQPWNISTGGTIARLYNENIAKAKVPVLPIEEQSHIVSVLDRIDALCNDLSSGLPAEIEARQKQYEYYRDKLLSFKEVV